jgi:hypothetical protein
MDFFEKFSPRVTIATSSWFATLDPAKYARIGISRGVPRGMPARYRRYTKLNPGPWFNNVTPERYRKLYFAEILAPLNPQKVVEELAQLADDRVAVLLCWEPPSASSAWCHRALVSAWLKEKLNIDVFEVTHEREGCGWSHPKMHPSFRAKR